MLKNPDYITARETLLAAVEPVGTETVGLSRCCGRVLAEDLVAAENIPAFDRSPYDGYAFRSADTAQASREKPVTLRILEEVPAGAVPTQPVMAGTATKILTGAPIPPGADAVINYEATEFTPETVTLFAPVRAGENIVYTGEDVKAGTVLVRRGEVIDPGTAGTLAAQGVSGPRVYRKLRIGVLSTGSELVEAEETPGPGKIRNSNRYTLEGALLRAGFDPVYLGTAGDSAEAIRALVEKGLADCDAVVSTGGVSAGDYDLTPEAMELAGVELLFRGTKIKPGMACAYGVRDGKPVCALSGNPASSMTNFYIVALPALKKLAGWAEPVPSEFDIRLLNGFRKKSKGTRFLRGTLVLENGQVCMRLPADQGNVVLSSAIGCNVMAVVPAGSGPLEAGTVLKGFLL